jgi:hypothetical protein
LILVLRKELRSAERCRGVTHMFVLSLRVLGRWERNVGTESLGANEGETIGLIALSHKNKRGVVRTRA